MYKRQILFVVLSGAELDLTILSNPLVLLVGVVYIASRTRGLDRMVRSSSAPDSTKNRMLLGDTQRSRRSKMCIRDSDLIILPQKRFFCQALFSESFELSELGSSRVSRC